MSTKLSEGLINEGHYVALCRANRTHIGYDHFVVKESSDGFLVKARHTLFTDPNIVQMSKFWLERNWVPRRLEVQADNGVAATVTFDENKTVIKAKTPRGERSNSFNTGRQTAYFLMNGAFYFPMLIVRRLDLASVTHKSFELVPTGLCEVRHTGLESMAEAVFDRVEINLLLDGVRDRLDLYIDSAGNLACYKTQNLELQVNLERRDS